MALQTVPAESGTWDSEQLVLCRDEALGLHAVIAIDDTRLGPALGGVRFRAYPTAAAGIRECRRLAAGMTLKNAVAEVPFGGAKSVIFADEAARADRAALMRRFGEFVARTGGAYLPGVDMGTAPADLALIAAAGAPVSCAERDPSHSTARGVWAAIRAALAHVDGSTHLDGVRVLVQGAGHVGGRLAEMLAHDGAALLIADADAERAAAVAEATRGAVVAPDAVIGTPCDVFAPCAIAGVLAADTVDDLACRIVAGAANDALAEPAVAEALASRGITYVPDFVANAGGVVEIHALAEAWPESRLTEELFRIGDRVHEILTDAAAAGTTPLRAAVARAEARLEAAR